EVVVELLDPRLVRDGRIGVVPVARWFARVDPAPAVDSVEALRGGIVRRERVVADRPRGRDSAQVAQLTEVLLSESEERRAVQLRVPSHEGMGLRPQRSPETVAPEFTGL